MASILSACSLAAFNLVLVFRGPVLLASDFSFFGNFGSFVLCRLLQGLLWLCPLLWLGFGPCPCKSCFSQSFWPLWWRLASHFAFFGFSDNANGWVSPYSPLPNLGNTCYIAAVLQMIRALGVAFPCSGDSWHATVQCLEQLGLHDGLQKDSRCFFGILVAQYPAWARQFSWLFGRQASCSTCGSVRDLPVDEQSVVDLPLVPGASHCLSTLLDTAVSSGEASLDCAACAGRKHHTLSGLSVANVRSSVFFHVRRSANGAKSRSIVRIPSSIVWFGRTFHLTAAVIHIGDAPDAGHYITLLPPSASVAPGWTCLDDGRSYPLAQPCTSRWHLDRDATLLLFTASCDSVPPAVASAVPLVAPAPRRVPPVRSNYDIDQSLPVQIVSANITSWYNGWPQLLADHCPSGHCLWLLTETHLSQSASRACASGLRQLGLHSVFRCGALPFSGTGRNPSGVSSACGVAAISTLPIREVPWKTDSLKVLAAAGRLLHITCGISGSQPLHAVVFYGVLSGGTTHLAVQRQNEEALSYIAEECVAWGQVPIVIGGDYNLHLSQSLTVTNLLFNGRWCDAAVEHARRCGDLDPPPTCFAKPGVSKGTRIDGLLLNSVLAKSFVSLSYPSSGLPTHRPLLLELSLATLNTFVVKHKVPQRIKNVEISKRPSAEACETHALGLWRAVAAEWQRARNNGDVPALWPLLTRTADAFYRWFAGLDSSKRSPVRGLPGSPSSVRVAPPRDRLSDAATSVKTAALQRFIRSLEHASRLRLKLAVDVTSAERFHEFQQLWKRIVGRAHLFVSPVDSPGVFDLGDLQVSCPDSWPKHNDLLQVIRVLESSVSRSHLLEQQTRLRSWRQSCRRKWRDPRQKRFIYS